MSEARLREFAGLVETWSRTINLVSRGDLPHLWERHVEDSLALAAHVPAGTTRAIDLGSGAGFPGMVLAVATGVAFTLIESDTRKAVFLREVARLLAAPVTVINSRIEVAKVAPAPLVTARALAPLDRLIGLALPHLAPGGVCLFPKGRGYAEELTAARRLWQMEATLLPVARDAAARILKLENIRHAGAG